MFGVMKWVDIPPIWLVVALLVTFWLAQFGTDQLGPIASMIGTVLLALGLLLMVLAIYELTRHRTTVIPHLEADHLVQTGIFRVSRNPIYLGDVLVLTGVILRWDVLVAVPLIPIFMWVLTSRFIKPEEARLERRFGTTFKEYTAQTRRWI